MKLEQRFQILEKIDFREFCDQEVRQKQKINIDVENGSQISIMVKNTVTQGWPQFMFMDSKQALC